MSLENNQQPVPQEGTEGTEGIQTAKQRLMEYVNNGGSDSHELDRLLAEAAQEGLRAYRNNTSTDT